MMAYPVKRRVTIHVVAIQKEAMQIFKDKSTLNYCLHITVHVISIARQEEEVEGKGFS